MNVLRATLVDIAREAGVSTATVDRVLNRRPGVKDRTRNRVFDVAARLGYIDDSTDPLKPDMSAQALVEMDFVLPSGTNTFILDLARHLESCALSRPDVRANIHRIEGFNPDELAAKLAELSGRTQGVGMIAIDHPTVREAIRSLSAAGTSVLTLVSDISNVPRVGYIGIDNRAAGRLAGYLLGRLLQGRPAKVALLAGSLSYRGHEEREMGFRHILSEAYPKLSIVEMREVRDDLERAYHEVKTLLVRHPDIAGIYNIGAGNRGVARALEESRRSNDVVFIGHELTDYSRRFLLSGTMDVVIDQNPRVEAREAIDRLSRAIRGEIMPASPHIRVQAIFRENIPE